MEAILKREYPLTAADIDNHRLCRLSALLNYMQNMATEHALILELGGDAMQEEHGAFWMMVRLHLELRRPIFFDDATLRIHTWHRGVTKGASVYRDFDLFIGEDHVGEAVISWVLADIQGRKIIKPGSIPALLDTQKPEQVKDIIPARIKMPEKLTQAMSRKVYYSDTDINGHMNNTKYADVACDAIQFHKCRGQFISEVQINYLCECFPGEELLILKGEEAGLHYVRGTDGDGKNRFEVRIRLSET